MGYSRFEGEHAFCKQTSLSMLALVSATEKMIKTQPFFIVIDSKHILWKQAIALEQSFWRFRKWLVCKLAARGVRSHRLLGKLIQSSWVTPKYVTYVNHNLTNSQPHITQYNLTSLHPPNQTYKGGFKTDPLGGSKYYLSRGLHLADKIIVSMIGTIVS